VGLALSIHFPPMRYFDHQDFPYPILNGIDNTINALPETKFLLSRKLFVARRPRII
jgi:hypothetical protein